jgi:hypothetical protein
MKSDVLVSLIKEVVKSEVKRQVKEEVIKLIKSGDISLNSNKKVENISKPKSSLSEMLDVTPTSYSKKNDVKAQSVKQFTKDPMLNEILSQTQPFTSAHRSNGGMGGSMMGSSVLDMLKPTVSMEGDWETMDYRDMSVPEQAPQIEATDNPNVDALAKALNRDYRELVKRF